MKVVIKDLQKLEYFGKVLMGRGEFDICFERIKVIKVVKKNFKIV